MNKKNIFISHIHEEANLALEIKQLIRKAYNNAFNIYVSSDPDNNIQGKLWLDDLFDKLNEADIIFVLSSPLSIKREWINFEAGAGWAKGIDVLPMCHSGLKKGDLPIPLSLRQSLNLSDEKDIKELLYNIGNLSELDCPKYDISGFIEKVKDIESYNTFGNKFIKCYNELINVIPELETLKSNIQIEKHLIPEHRDIVIKNKVELKYIGITIAAEFGGIGFYHEPGFGVVGHTSTNISIDENFVESRNKYIH